MRYAYILIVLGASLALIGITYAYRYTHPVYFADHWGYVEAWFQWQTGESNFWDFFHRKHNDHRIGLTKLTLVADFAWAHGSSFVLTTTMLALLLASGAALGWAASDGAGTADRIAASTLFAASLVGVTSLGNTSWPSQIQFAFAQAVPIALFLAALYLPGRLGTGIVLVLALACAETMANGFTAPLIAGALLLAVTPYRSRGLLLIVGGVLALGLMLMPTARDFTPNNNPALGLSNILFFFGGASAVLEAAGVKAAVAIGLVASVSLAVGALLFVMRGVTNDRASLVLLATALYAAASLAAMAVVRGTGTPLTEALTSRYATTSLVFLLSTGGFLYRQRALLDPLGYLGAGLCAAAIAFSAQSDRALLEVARRNAGLNQAYLSMALGPYDAGAYQNAYPDPEAVRRLTEYLRLHGKGIFRKNRSKGG